MFRNGWQLSAGIGGNFAPEWVAGMRRNTHNFNVFENVRNGGVFVADQGSLGAVGKTIEQRLGKSVVDYFYFVR